MAHTDSFLNGMAFSAWRSFMRERDIAPRLSSAHVLIPGQKPGVTVKQPRLFQECSPPHPARAASEPGQRLSGLCFLPPALLLPGSLLRCPAFHLPFGGVVTLMMVFGSGSVFPFRFPFSVSTDVSCSVMIALTFVVKYVLQMLKLLTMIAADLNDL